MTTAQRARYAAALRRVLAALTTVDAMVHQYPAAENQPEPAAAYELEDLAARLEALTATWDGAPPLAEA